MKNFKKLVTCFCCLSIGSLSLVSCIDDSDTTPQAAADVIIQDMKTDTGIKYGVVIYASANVDLSSVKVTSPGTPGKVYNLTATSYKSQFVYTPQASEYTSSMPVKGDYTIEVITTGGQTLNGKDIVGDEKLSPIVIKSATMNSQKLKVTWDKVSGAAAYIVRLYTANKEKLIYASNYIDKDAVEYEFSSTSDTWATGESPKANTMYVVELAGVKVETGVTVDQAYNLQFITVDTKDIKWE